VIGMDCIGSFKSLYHMGMTLPPPPPSQIRENNSPTIGQR